MLRWWPRKFRWVSLNSAISVWMCEWEWRRVNEKKMWKEREEVERMHFCVCASHVHQISWRRHSCVDEWKCLISVNDSQCTIFVDPDRVHRVSTPPLSSKWQRTRSRFLQNSSFHCFVTGFNVKTEQKTTAFISSDATQQWSSINWDGVTSKHSS